jgi:hypothetical protein
MFGIPDKYFWPGLVIALLISSVAWSVGLMLYAGSDGGAQVVDDYYDRAVRFDEIRATEDAAARAGWRVQLQWPAEAGESLTLRIVDADGDPVGGLQGSVELRRPELSGALGRAELVPVAHQAGRYRVDLSPDRAGLWDVVVEASSGSQDYRIAVREEVSL